MTLGSVALALALVGCGARGGEPSAPSSPAPGGGSGAGGDLGATVYQRCAGCHGPQGTGGSFPTASLVNIERLTDDQIRGIIENGKGRSMPAWKGRLSEEEIAAVIEYIKKF